MKGNRRYADPDGTFEPLAWDHGDFGRDPESGTWYALTPNGALANISGHTITEHEDGSITVTPSILVRTAEEELYHGFLTNGEWRP